MANFANRGIPVWDSLTRLFHQVKPNEIVNSASAADLPATPSGALTATDAQGQLDELEANKADTADLGTAAYKNTGLEGDAVPLLNQVARWAASQQYNAANYWFNEAGATDTKAFRVAMLSNARLEMAPVSDNFSSVGSVAFRLTKNSSQVTTNAIVAATTINLTGNTVNAGNITPGTDDTYDLGSSSFRWDDVYATNGTIQTSDARDKHVRGELSAKEIAAWGAVQPVVYQWLSSIDEKGDDAREHVGLIAQKVRAAFAAEGLDAGRYGLFIAAPMIERSEVTKEITYQRQKVERVEREVSGIEFADGKAILMTRIITEDVPVTEDVPLFDAAGNDLGRTVARPVMEDVTETTTEIEETPIVDENGDPVVRYGLRYIECLMFEAAYQRAVVADLKRRIAKLESASKK